ncbi:hypothetical protein H8959_007440, partial [Pygathrix nigripes]
MKTFASSCVLERVKFSLDGSKMKSAITPAVHTLPHHCSHCETDNMAFQLECLCCRQYFKIHSLLPFSLTKFEAISS